MAVVISVVALVLSVVALKNTDTQTVTPVPSASGPAGIPSPAGTDAGGGTPSVTTSGPQDTGPVDTTLPSPGASYTVVHQDVPLILAGGQSARELDLDQPMVNSPQVSTDLSYIPYQTPPYLQFNSANVAVARSPDVTPAECANAIQLSPSDTTVRVSQDLVICVVTNGFGAVNEPARAKMARIIINSVGKDDSLNMTLTTWEIPH